MIALLSNVFYDPSNPWYYVIGVVFLILIFGALTAYIMLSKKFGKDKNGAADEPSGAESGTDTDSGASADENVAADAESSEPTDKN